MGEGRDMGSFRTNRMPLTAAGGRDLSTVSDAGAFAAGWAGSGLEGVRLCPWAKEMLPKRQVKARMGKIRIYFGKWNEEKSVLVSPAVTLGG